jgi:hypothetical protein
MSLDPSLAGQRRMIRDQWARDAARLRQPARPAEASLQQPVPASRLLRDVPADEGEHLRAARQIRTGEREDQEPTRRPAVSQPGARPPWHCPEDLPDGQREVLQLLHRERVDLAAVLRSRDRDAQAPSVRHVLEAERRVGLARAGQVMAAARTGDAAVSQLAPVDIERLLTATGHLQ